MIAPYQATSAEQLDLQRGQLIMIRKKTDTGWWEGELQVCSELVKKSSQNFLHSYLSISTVSY